MDGAHGNNLGGTVERLKGEWAVEGKGEHGCP